MVTTCGGTRPACAVCGPVQGRVTPAGFGCLRSLSNAFPIQKVSGWRAFAAREPPGGKLGLWTVGRVSREGARHRPLSSWGSEGSTRGRGRRASAPPGVLRPPRTPRSPRLGSLPEAGANWGQWRRGPCRAGRGWPKPNVGRFSAPGSPLACAPFLFPPAFLLLPPPSLFSPSPLPSSPLRLPATPLPPLARSFEARTAERRRQGHPRDRVTPWAGSVRVTPAVLGQGHPRDMFAGPPSGSPRPLTGRVTSGTWRPLGQGHPGRPRAAPVQGHPPLRVRVAGARVPFDLFFFRTRSGHPPYIHGTPSIHQ